MSPLRGPFSPAFPVGVCVFLALTPTQALGCACAGREVAQCAGRLAMRGGPAPISQLKPALAISNHPN
jgi:hypothetical protein